MNPNDAPPDAGDPIPSYRLGELTAYALGLGTWGFGGPVALVGYMHRDLVERRRWIPTYHANQPPTQRRSRDGTARRIDHLGDRPGQANLHGHPGEFLLTDPCSTPKHLSVTVSNWAVIVVRFNSDLPYFATQQQRHHCMTGFVIGGEFGHQ